MRVDAAGPGGPAPPRPQGHLKLPFGNLTYLPITREGWAGAVGQLADGVAYNGRESGAVQRPGFEEFCGRGGLTARSGDAGGSPTGTACAGPSSWAE